jgi:glycosyltransferase involved in cell wall biosynthesis
MKLIIICNGKFHHFNQAKALFELNKLQLLISTYPYSIAKTYGIPKSKFVSLWPLELLKRSIKLVLRKELPFVGYSRLFNYTVIVILAIKKLLRDEHGYIVQAGYSLEIIMFLRRYAKVKLLLDRGSLHTKADKDLRTQAQKHAEEQLRFRTKTYNPAFTRREELEYSLVDFIMVPSHFSADTFLRNGIQENKLIVNPFPWDSVDPSDGNLHPYDIYPGIVRKHTVLFVGNKSSRKGFHVLLKAMECLNNDSTVHLIAVGSAGDVNIPDYDWLHNIDAVPRQELAQYYKNCSCFCLPSYAEGLALVLCEASYYNLHIIATPNTGVQSLQLEASRYTLCGPPGDANALAKSIKNYLDTEVSRHTGDNINIIHAKPNIIHTWRDHAFKILNTLSSPPGYAP